MKIGFQRLSVAIDKTNTRYFFQRPGTIKSGKYAMYDASRDLIYE